MYCWANSRCKIENSGEKEAVVLHPLYIIGLKIVPRDIAAIKIPTALYFPLRIFIKILLKINAYKMYFGNAQANEFLTLSYKIKGHEPMSYCGLCNLLE